MCNACDTFSEVATLESGESQEVGPWESTKTQECTQALPLGCREQTERNRGRPNKSWHVACFRKAKPHVYRSEQEMCKVISWSPTKMLILQILLDFFFFCLQSAQSYSVAVTNVCRHFFCRDPWCICPEFGVDPFVPKNLSKSINLIVYTTKWFCLLNSFRMFVLLGKYNHLFAF